MKRLRVLLADDHRIVAEGLRQLLEPEFDLVGVVGDGRALLKAASELKPDVIVTDISMPELNGLDALEELRKVDPDARVVILTMYDKVAFASKALDAGAAGFVLKQSAPEELALAVRSAAAGRTFVTAELADELMRVKKLNKDPVTNPLWMLTLRQREILRLLIDGHSAKAIANRLDISSRTVESHKYSIMESVGVSSTVELVRFAYQSGFAET